MKAKGLLNPSYWLASRLAAAGLLRTTQMGIVRIIAELRAIATNSACLACL
jgi:hypothetical protein